MSGPVLAPCIGDTAYWHERVRAETRAALACDDPHIAALHVELATRCLRRAQEQESPPRTVRESA